MKTFILTLCLLVVFEDCIGHKGGMHQIFNDCLNENGIIMEEFKTLLKSQDIKAGCTLQCKMKKIGTMTNDNVIDVEALKNNFKQMAKRMHFGEKLLNLDVVDVCAKDAEKAQDGCKKALILKTCFLESDEAENDA